MKDVAAVKDVERRQLRPVSSPIASTAARASSSRSSNKCHIRPRNQRSEGVRGAREMNSCSQIGVVLRQPIVEKGYASRVGKSSIRRSSCAWSRKSARW